MAVNLRRLGRPAKAGEVAPGGQGASIERGFPAEYPTNWPMRRNSAARHLFILPKEGMERMDHQTRHEI